MFENCVSDHSSERLVTPKKLILNEVRVGVQLTGHCRPVRAECDVSRSAEGITAVMTEGDVTWL